MAQTFIYAVFNETDHTVKIGYSINPYKRLAQIQNGSGQKLKILFTFIGDEGVEKTIHNKLKKYRLSGEWFSANPEVLKVLQLACVESLAINFNNAVNFSQNFAIRDFLEEYCEETLSNTKTKKRTRIYFKNLKAACEDCPEVTPKVIKDVMQDLGFEQKTDASRVIFFERAK